MFTLPPVRSPVLVITSGAGSTTILSVPDVTLTGCPSVSRAVNEKVPNTVGVPAITPVAGSSNNPAGRAPLASAHV